MRSSPTAETQATESLQDDFYRLVVFDSAGTAVLLVSQGGEHHLPKIGIPKFARPVQEITQSLRKSWGLPSIFLFSGVFEEESENSYFAVLESQEGICVHPQNMSWFTVHHALMALVLSERERRAVKSSYHKASGTDTEEHFNRVEAINHGVTFRKQAEWWLNHAQTRKRKPIKPATAVGFTSYLNKWLNPSLGDLPLSSVNNLTAKGLVATMAKAGVSPKMITNVIQMIKMVVASAVNENGEKIHPRVWNHEFIDLPEVKDQRQPTHSSETMKAIAAGSKGRERMLFALLGATGLRFGEVFGLEIDKHISDDFSTLYIRQKVWSGQVQPFLKTGNGVRDIDLPSPISAMLRKFVGTRISGFVFCSKNGFPLLQSNVLRLSLHPLLRQLGQPKSGAHAFRRFRATWLRKQHAPEDLIRFWLGHANKSITDLYSKLKDDVMFRKKVAEEVGIGFELPEEKLEVAPCCTHTELLSDVL